MEQNKQILNFVQDKIKLKILIVYLYFYLISMYNISFECVRLPYGEHELRQANKIYSFGSL